MVKAIFAAVAVVLALPARAEDERVWDHGAAQKLVAQVTALEQKGQRPWNWIPWRNSAAAGASEAARTGKPILIFFFVKQEGPPRERCCPAGRLLRGRSLSNSTVLSIIKRNYIPVKVGIEPGAPFPLAWPALERWATLYKFTNPMEFAGCSVVSTDLLAEYGNSGSATLAELFDSTAYDPKKFKTMLERSVSRNLEERALRSQSRISASERQMEVTRVRQGFARAVRAEGRRQMPPKGYTLAKALELFGRHRPDPAPGAQD